MILSDFIQMLAIDSTSGQEAGFGDFLAEKLKRDANRLEIFEVGDGTRNLFFSWGNPELVFCTHIDTVPPYIAASVDGDVIRGRGSCDAKGQIFAMYSACVELEKEGCDGFGLLLLSGEETGSWGAKAMHRLDDFKSKYPCARTVIVGEPTDNCMASAAKGTKSFGLTFRGEPCHSGYPEQGSSAVDHFVNFCNALRTVEFPEDSVLGQTSWNIGKLYSDNPQNILSGELKCRLYFRTTFESDAVVCGIMKNIAGEDARMRLGRDAVKFDGPAPWQKAMGVEAYGGDAPLEYMTLPGFETKPVAFGSDAPYLDMFENRILCGPGSIMTAHTDRESVSWADLETAVMQYRKMFYMLTDKLC